MKIVFNDNRGSQNVGSTRIWILNLHEWFKQRGYSANLNVWDSYKDFDVAIFGKNVKINEFKKARKGNDRLMCGVVNPSDFTKGKREILEESDFVIVGSIEERDYYYKYKNKVLIFPLIEKMFNKTKKHEECSPITIGYHGNLDHLTQFHPYLKEALDVLSREIPVKLIAIYNKKDLPSWTMGRPNINIEEVQWEYETIEDVLLQCDIGLVPGLAPISARAKKNIFYFMKCFQKSRGSFSTDYLLRFKNTTNSGRAFVFHQLGIPVISDFIPSSFHILSNPKCGYLANSKEGWLFALRELCGSAEIRQEIAKNAKDEFHRLYDPLKWSTRLHNDIERLWKSRDLPGN